jgi:hypothetical protein
MVQQQHVHLLILGLLPMSVSAFSTTRSLQTKRLFRPTVGVRQTRRVTFSDDARGTNGHPKLTTNTAEIDIVPAEDFAKELCMANIENASPENLFGPSALAASGVEEVVTPSAPDVFGFTLKTNTTVKSVAELGQKINQQVVTTRNVEAVLAASKEAMIAAEASLLTDVKEELILFAGVSARTNSTDIRVPTTVKDLVKKMHADDRPVTKTQLHIVAPSVMTIMKFAIPAVGVWLCSPMLSLIDTSAVGILSGTTQQAALNPAVAVTDYAALLMVRQRTVYMQNSVRTVPSLTFSLRC